MVASPSRAASRSTSARARDCDAFARRTTAHVVLVPSAYSVCMISTAITLRERVVDRGGRGDAQRYGFDLPALASGGVGLPPRSIERRGGGVQSLLGGGDASLTSGRTGTCTKELNDILVVRTGEHAEPPSPVATNAASHPRGARSKRGSAQPSRPGPGKQEPAPPRARRPASPCPWTDHRRRPRRCRRAPVAHRATRGDPRVEDAGRLEGGFDVAGVSCIDVGAEVNELVERRAGRRVALGSPVPGAVGARPPRPAARAVPRQPGRALGGRAGGRRPRRPRPAAHRRVSARPCGPPLATRQRRDRRHMRPSSCRARRRRRGEPCATTCVALPSTLRSQQRAGLRLLLKPLLQPPAPPLRPPRSLWRARPHRPARRALRARSRTSRTRSRRRSTTSRSDSVRSRASPMTWSGT